MMLCPERSGVSGLGCGLPRRVPSPAARMTTCLATGELLDCAAAANDPGQPTHGRGSRPVSCCAAWMESLCQRLGFGTWTTPDEAPRFGHDTAGLRDEHDTDPCVRGPPCRPARVRPPWRPGGQG